MRGVLGTTALVVLYYALPLDEPWNGDTAVRVLIGLLVFAGLTVWQVRTIAGARYPGVKAFEALGMGCRGKPAGGSPFLTRAASRGLQPQTRGPARRTNKTSCADSEPARSAAAASAGEPW